MRGARGGDSFNDLSISCMVELDDKVQSRIWKIIVVFRQDAIAF